MMKSLLDWLEWQKQPTNVKLGMILMVLLPTLFIVNGLASIFNPPRMMNCEEAKEDLTRSELREKSEWKRLEDGRSPSLGAANVAIQDAKKEVELSKSAVRVACKN